jgi:hypothetical protein
MNEEISMHGLIAEFSDRDELLVAAQRAHDAGYRCMDAYSPFPIEGLAEAIGHKHTAIPFIVLCGGIVGGLGGYFMEWFAMKVDYPLNIGGRPLHSWPIFIPITFELTVLIASLSAVIGMLALNKLPEPYHPVFNASGFERASTDKFFLCIESRDPKFDASATKKFLENLAPDSVKEVLR